MAQTVCWQTGWLTLLVATLTLTTLKSTLTLTLMVVMVVVPVPSLKAYKVNTALEQAQPTIFFTGRDPERKLLGLGALVSMLTPSQHGFIRARSHLHHRRNPAGHRGSPEGASPGHHSLQI